MNIVFVPELPYCAYISKLSYIIYTNMIGTDKNIFHFKMYLVPTTLWKDSTAYLFHNCLWLLLTVNYVRCARCMGLILILFYANYRNIKIAVSCSFWQYLQNWCWNIWLLVLCCGNNVNISQILSCLHYHGNMKTSNKTQLAYLQYQPVCRIKFSSSEQWIWEYASTNTNWSLW